MDKKNFIKKARELQKDYKPSQNVRDQLARLDLLAVVGPTGVGKTTIIEQSKVHFVLSDVTRDEREGEEDGRDYYFRKDYDRLMEDIESGEFVQYVISSETNEFYGTKRSSYPSDGACTMAIYANIINFFKTLGFHKVVPIYIIPPGYEEWMQRIKSHQDADLPERMVEARESLTLALGDPSYYFIVNGNLGMALDQFQQLASGTVPSTVNLHAARELARTLLIRLGAAS